MATLFAARYPTNFSFFASFLVVWDNMVSLQGVSGWILNVHYFFSYFLSLFSFIVFRLFGSLIFFFNHTFPFISLLLLILLLLFFSRSYFLYVPGSSLSTVGSLWWSTQRRTTLSQTWRLGLLSLKGKRCWHDT